MFEAGATALITAGLTNGITVNNGDVGWSSTYSGNSLAALAGVQSVGNALVPQAGNATSSIPTEIAAIAGEAAIQAGVQTAIDGGGFLTNLRNSAVSDVAAAAAFAIGNAGEDPNSILAQGSVGYDLAHAALGCAAGAANGTGCAGGAIGGATSAALSPYVTGQFDPTGAPPDPGQAAIATAIAMLAGGGLAGVLGQNVTGAATAAANEAENNSLKHVLCLLCAITSFADGPTINDDPSWGLSSPEDALQEELKENVEPSVRPPIFTQGPPKK